MSRVTAILKFLAGVAKKAGASEHLYVVGGAVRNHLLGLDPKDQDLVVDALALGPGRDSAWIAKQILQEIPVRVSLVTNQYGVAILSIVDPWALDGHQMKGETIEIANARRESYGKASGKGYKPDNVEAASIEEDLARRDFTVNTLLWRFDSLEHGLASARVLDLTGKGLEDLRNRVLCTPCDPDRTFTDDPTRMLRAIKFASKYGFHIHPDAANSIAKNALTLLSMPWDAVRKILVDDVLLGPNPRESLRLLKLLGLNEPIVRLLNEEPGFFTGVSRGLAGIDSLLMLDLWDLGWQLKGSPGHLVKNVNRLRRILERDPANAAAFMQALNKPPVNQEALFLKLNLQGAARSAVHKRAREVMLDEPSLAFSPDALEDMVERLLTAAV